jgi:ubiquinone biosynthesis protein
VSRTQRLSKIFRVALRYRLDTFIDQDKLPNSWRVKLLASPSRLLPEPKRPRGERLRLALEALGPIFVKFGQMLSTRRDLLPPDIAEELAKLQDQVPPFCKEKAVAIIEEALEQPVSELFAEFSNEPLASASVAQVHAATLHSGEEVVVKVVRPDIEKTIRQDIALLFILARFIERNMLDGKRLRPVEVVAEYQHTIIDELDLQREASNTSQLRRNFENSNKLYIPLIFWDYTRNNVLVMERIHGIPVTDIDQLHAQGTNMRALAERGVEIFFTQVFRDNFFHADMHPGNIFVSREDPEQPQYIGIDCAIIGSLSDHDRYYLARNMLAIFQRDYHQVALLHIECGWVPAKTRPEEFEAAIRSAMEPIFEKPLGEISFGQLLIYLFQTARRFDMEVQPSLVLLQKTLLNIEGLGRQLYPELDLWKTAFPYLEQWLKERYSPKGMLERTKKHLPSLLEQLPDLPEALLDNLQQSKQLQTISDGQQRKIDHLEQQLAQQARQKRNGNTAAVLLLAAIALAFPDSLEQLKQLPAWSWGLAIASVWLWLRR